MIANFPKFSTLLKTDSNFFLLHLKRNKKLLYNSKYYTLEKTLRQLETGFNYLCWFDYAAFE